MAKRRRGMSKRGRMTTKYKPVLIDGQALRQLQVYRYPFSVATSQPKIPDGCTSNTIGVKLQQQITSAHHNQIFVLVPMFGTLLSRRVMVPQPPPQGGGLPPPDQPSYEHYYTGDIVPAFTITNTPAVPGPPIVPQHTESLNESPFSSWRLVSAGLRLKCTSNDNVNGGYWEAVRINVNESGMQHVMRTLDPSTPTDARGRFKLTEAFLDTLATKQNWLNNPTYQIGKIKSLSQFEFRLSPQTEDHLFYDIPRVIETQDSMFVPQTNAYVENDGVDIKHLYDWGVDNQWDIIAVSISGEENSRVLAHAVANYELKVGSSHNQQIFSTETTNAGSAIKQKQTDYKIRDRLPGHYLSGPRS